MKAVIDELSKIGMIPVVSTADADALVRLAGVLSEAGMPCLELDLRREGALEALARLKKECPGVTIGAGMARDGEETAKAVEAGADFVTTYCLSGGVLEGAGKEEVPVIPFVATPAELEKAVRKGASCVIVDIGAWGGEEKLMLFREVRPEVSIIISGEDAETDPAYYLNGPGRIAVRNKELADPSLLEQGELDAIGERAAEAISRIVGFYLEHVGINGKDEAYADSVAREYDRLFGFAWRMGKKSIFAGKYIEVMKSPFLGEMGHLAIGTNNVKRGMYQLCRKGAEFDESTAGYQPDGSIKAIYMKGDIGGFAIHLFQKP